MKKFSAILAVFAVGALCFMAPASGSAQDITGTTTTIRASAVLTTSDVLSTTQSVNYYTLGKAAHIYVNIANMGGLTGITVTPAGARDAAIDGYIAPTNFYRDSETSQTFTAAGQYHMRVPREAFGSADYWGVFSRGTGTATSSDMEITYKREN